MILVANEKKTSNPWATGESVAARELLARRNRSDGDLKGAEASTGYLRELYRRELLSPAEEVVLF